MNGAARRVSLVELLIERVEAKSGDFIVKEI